MSMIPDQPADILCPQANLPAVNEAVNNLLIEEEDFTSLRESISTYDAFDQIGLASRLESHELLEFRRTAAAIYKNNQRWRKAIALAKQDHLYKVSWLQSLLAVSIRVGRARQPYFKPGLSNRASAMERQCCACCMRHKG